MTEIRRSAAMLAILTAMIAGFLFYDPGTSTGVAIGAAVAALCLAVIVPFPALEPPERKRVVAACVAFVLATGAALALAVLTGAVLVTMGTLALLAAAGLALVVWSFRTRNRRRRPHGWANYYDM